MRPHSGWAALVAVAGTPRVPEVLDRRRIEIAEAVREKEIWERASADLRSPIAELQQLVNAVGKSIGPPWTQDQKLAALSGWLALAGSRERSRSSGRRRAP